MKKFTTTLNLEAKAMSRQDYNDFRGWELPSDENGDDKGYIIVKDGEPNTDTYDGYVQWITEDQFQLEGWSEIEGE